MHIKFLQLSEKLSVSYVSTMFHLVRRPTLWCILFKYFCTYVFLDSLFVVDCVPELNM